ncbi:MAG: hypothetical protein KDB84_01580, partial [Flavobacteriales bacterium]|nr:hypothetical protein [Flavobacteriales bacterium]
MRSRSLLVSFSLLAMLLIGPGVVPDVLGQAQPANCGSCNCNPSSVPTNTDPTIADPGIGNTTPVFIIPVAAPYRQFTVTAGNRYLIRFCSTV